MKKRQVMTFHPDGSVSGLQVKPGQGVQLTSMGDAKVTRASEIAWLEDAQAWHVNVLVGPEKGPVTFDKLDRALGDEGPDHTASLAELNELAPSGWGTSAYEVGCSIVDTESDLIFASYPEAVQVEIAFLDALRVQGRFTNQTE